MAFFDHVAMAPPDPILGLIQAFQNDPRPHKVNLSVGYYRTAELKTTMMACVKKAESALLNIEKPAEYLPIDGDKGYLEKVGNLVFGNSFWSKESSRIASAQCVGGTSALRLGGDFLKHEVGDAFFISEPSWTNHRGVFSRCGMKIENYHYYDRSKHTLDFERLYHFFERLAPKSIVLLHASCHNPTGVDPTIEQWQKLSDLFLAKKLIPFFDLAYQGFGKGVEADVEAIRLFAKMGHEMCVAVSFSKNFSLYAQRVGAFFTVTDTKKSADNVLSKFKTLIRSNYSNPPRYGSDIVAYILGNPSFKKEWEDELETMRSRINEMRRQLTGRLIAKSQKVDYRYLNDRLGMFCFCALKKEQVDKLIADYAIYMTSDGRINIVGLNEKNIDYVVDAIIAVS